MERVMEYRTPRGDITAVQLRGYETTQVTIDRVFVVVINPVVAAAFPFSIRTYRDVLSRVDQKFLEPSLNPTSSLNHANGPA
jgi:hypothetical protein